jgi:hypothetical protein
MNINNEVTELVVGDKPTGVFFWCRIITLLPVLMPYVYGYVLFEDLKRVVDFFAFHLLDSHLKEFLASRQQSEAPCRALDPNPPKTPLKTVRRRVRCKKAPPI